MIGNDHVRFGRGPSGKGLAAASNSPDGLPHLHPSPARHAEHTRSQRATHQPDLTQRDRSASRLGQDRSRSSPWHWTRPGREKTKHIALRTTSCTALRPLCSRIRESPSHASLRRTSHNA
jgi:hypothetical protein